MTRTTCPSCGTASAAAAKFCAECGGRLPGAPPTPSGDEAPRQSIERRQLTVMFCDLVESTRLSLQLDAEDFTRAVSAYRDACARTVRDWGGHVSRYVGDGVLVYFGYPRASADDAMRSVVCAWELAQAIARLSLPGTLVGPEAGRPLQLQVRVSLHTGLAVVGDVVGNDTLENDSAMGAVPNIAARLQALAQPGTVVVSETTAALLPPTITLRQLEPVTPQRDLGALRAFTIVAVPAKPALGRPVTAGLLVGRQASLDRLLAALADTGTRAPALFLRADPGVGKSRLVNELVQHEATAGVTWIRLACTPYDQLAPLHPFRGWIDELETPAAGADAPVSARSAAGEPPSDLPASPYDRRRRIFGHLRAALLSKAPCVGLALEDVHWADSTTIDFVAELLASAPAGRLIVVMTSRLPPPDALAASGKLQVEQLERLAAGDAAALAHALAADRPLSAFELGGIVQHAEGVPLYIEEFVRALRATEPGPDNIPITLRDSLMSVLDALGAGRTVALCASVFGRRFEYEQLRELLALDDAELVPAVRALTQAQVLVQDGQIPAASFEFRHALVRDTAYHTLLKSERARWHRRLAELAAAGKLAIGESMPELLATHYSLGGSYERAIGYWLQAQERAMHRSAHVEALAHIRSGLEDCRHLAQDAPALAARLELELLCKLAAPLIAISGWSTPELEEVYARAMRLCGPADAEDAAFELERGLYNVHLLRSELRTADGYADRLLATAKAAGAPQRRAALMLVALRSKALPAFYAAEPTRARPHLERLLSIYDPVRDADHAYQFGIEPAMLALSYLAWMDIADGQTSTAAMRIERSLARARVGGHVFSICYALCFAASCAQLVGDVDAAERHAAQAHRLANQHNFAYWMAWAKAVGGWVRGLQATAAGIAQIDEARREYEALGSSLVTPYFDALACHLARSAGLPDQPRREAVLQAYASRTGVRFWEVVLR